MSLEGRAFICILSGVQPLLVGEVISGLVTGIHSQRIALEFRVYERVVRSGVTAPLQGRIFTYILEPVMELPGRYPDVLTLGYEFT